MSEDDEHSYIDTGVGAPDRLTRLWAPYRSAYITRRPRSGTSGEDPFVAAAEGTDEEGLVVARGRDVYALLNLYPYNAGHLLVVPYRKVANLEDLEDSEAAELWQFVTRAVRVLKRASNPEGINVGINLGKASGGSVGDHLHVHIVPRWAGDANFMTVFSETKVLPATLRQTRAVLAEGWRELDRAEQGEA